VDGITRILARMSPSIIADSQLLKSVFSAESFDPLLEDCPPGIHIFEHEAD